MDNKNTIIKVLFLLSNLSGGGAQRTIVNLLKGLDRRKFMPSLALLDYNSNDAYASLIPSDIEIINLNSRGRYAAWKIKRLIESNEPDILFSTLPQVNFAVWLGNKISKKSVKLILRETNYRDVETNTTVFKQKLYQKMYKDADKVIALSEGVRKHMVKTYRLKESKVIRIYNPVDIENIKKLSMEICNIKYTKKFKLIACGRLAKQKNYSMLVNALSMLKQKDCSDFELFIMGTGPDEAEIIKLIETKGLKENIKLIGFQTNPYAYMKQADLFVLSSLWEGFGHVVVEAMACGTPVLSTDCPHGPREILENGKYGWLVPNNGSDQLAGMLEYLMFEPNEINLMSTKVCERAKSFNFTNIVQQYEIIFIKVKEE